MTDEKEPGLREQLEGLVAYKRVFTGDTFTFGVMKFGGGMPMYDFSDGASRFMDDMYRLGWVKADFDWPAWAGTPEAQRLVNDAAALEAATAEDLARLLTAHLRQERFCEGHLGGMFDTGHLTAIVVRAERLLEALDADQ
ncbi:MAG: hypothetical protein KF757_09440 [Phycisphaeraceae bacterium]|nr:hypothetical protein [Phycisphaeraceae bacterium]MCW5763431.1 hypothetical protein [Phycisphaeraceae bacterium]